MSAVFLVLALFAVIGIGLAGAFTDSSPAPGPASPVVIGGTAKSTLPTPTQFPPQNRVEETHRALHAMGRACKVPISTRRPGSVRGPVETMEQFARDFPNGGFTMDDEPGSTLSLLVVVRYELQSCDPSLLPSVDELLPERFRDPA
ncbi:hypothetical protein K8Z61_18050 [Nocardioides sp. TRM66260-LWL]|uniref:hypothetical protein n=1 Tax=Nocardioides sp. TRM66260-LWL TaxID=2874478 RepID=UPI001CC60EA1|nr:hypothetical protein [Nocardioides sp. TRM66260-LWL]MBZ5736398.1 hypothetical protein [Nocardioides sp. TRM66260-LWL]